MDSTVTCWGDNTSRQADAPNWRFDAVSASWAHTCGLRTNGVAVCWGWRGSGATDVPTGTYIAISATTRHSCGVRTDGTVACWGDNVHDRSRPPAGALRAVSAGRGHNCAVRDSGEAVCWGNNGSGQAEAPNGEFSSVAVGYTHSCGLRADKAIVCWGSNNDAPGGEFSAVTAGYWHSCGLHTDGTVACWGDNGEGQTDAPEGLFSYVGLGSWHSCAVRADRTAVCWGWNSNGQAEAPGGEFARVGGGSWHSCGLRTDRTIVCWGAGGDGQLDAPDGEFVSVDVGERHSCAIGVDGSVECWGLNEFGQTDAPDGEFVAVAVGERHSCAIGVDGSVECWGLADLALAPPSRVLLASFVDQADPGSCRPRGNRGVTAGFPLPSWLPRPIGTARVAVLFVEFPDAVASHSTQQEAELGLPFAERYLETVSYGLLDIEFASHHRWLRAERGHSHYLAESAIGPKQLGHALAVEAVRLADPDIDFTDYDLMMIVMPSSHFGGGVALGAVGTDEGFVSTPLVNVFTHEESRPPDRWGEMAAHELLHGLGLVDYYPYDDSHSDRPVAPSGREWVDVRMGVMGLWARFIASSQDPRLAHVWRHPDGYRSTAYHLRPPAIEMLAWSRWQLGWLDAAQVACLTDDGATVLLSPVADPGSGTAMAAVPLSDYEALVVESRRKMGYDSGQDYRSPDGPATTFPALVTEGVLVYTVDASLHSGELPLKVAGDRGNGIVDDYPVLAVGESVTVRGYTITVVDDDGDTHTVRIVKASDA